MSSIDQIALSLLSKTNYLADISEKRNSIKDIQQEDIQISTMEFEKLKVAELICCSLAVLGIICGVVVYEYSYDEDSFDSNLNQLEVTLPLSTFLTWMLMVAVIWRTKTELRWLQSKRLYSPQDTLWTTGMIKTLIFELILNYPHPHYGLTTEAFHVYNPIIEDQIAYTYHGILSVIMFIRFYHLTRITSILSIYRSCRMQRLCQLNGAYAGNTFAIKCMSKEKPFKTIGAGLAMGLYIFGHSLRVFERPASQDFELFQNNVWNIIITMTTVGYGDIYPITELGRAVGFAACMYGVAIVSLTVVTSSSYLFCDTTETRSLLILQRLRFKSHMQETAAFVITSAMRYLFMLRRGYTDKLKLQIQLGKFRRYLNNFQALKIQQRSLYAFDTFEERTERKLLALLEQRDMMAEKLESVNQSIEHLKESIGTIKNQRPFIENN